MNACQLKEWLGVELTVAIADGIDGEDFFRLLKNHLINNKFFNQRLQLKFSTLTWSRQPDFSYLDLKIR